DPIVDSDEAIAEALRTVSVPALIASVTYLTGDPALLRGPIRPREWIHNEFQGALTEEEKDQLRRDCLKVICAWRDAGCPPPLSPSADLVRETMNWVACEPVSDEYSELYAEEMDLSGTNPRAIELDADIPADFSVLIIGCGEAGLLAGIRLKEAGIP